MLRVLLACLALVALAHAAGPSCNQTFACVKNGQSCAPSGDDFVSVSCADGNYCDGSHICQKSGVLGGSCSSSNSPACFDSSYELSCASSVCKYLAGIYGPGDTCTTDTNYDNGGCATGLTCSTTCSSVALNGDCSGSALSNCAVGLYCNGTVCLTRKNKGDTCASSVECGASYYCPTVGTNAGKCSDPFQGAENDACDGSSTADWSGGSIFYDCGAGLTCSGGKCITPAATGACHADGTCDQAYQFCECNGATTHGNNVTEDGSTTCFNPDTNTQAEITDYNSYQSCAATNKCHDVNSAGAAIAKGPNQCIAQCIQSNFDGGYVSPGGKYNSCSGGSGSSAAIFPSFVAIVALFVYAIFA